MSSDNGQVNLIEEDSPSSLKLRSEIKWVRFERVRNINALSQQTGERYEAIVFCDNSELLQKLMFISADGRGYLLPDIYQMVDTVIHVRIYYLDKRSFYDDRWEFHFHDQVVDQERISDSYEQVKGWSITTMKGEYMRVDDDDSLFDPAEEIFEV